MKKTIIILIIIAVVLLCCIIAAVTTGAAWYILSDSDSSNIQIDTTDNFPTEKPETNQNIPTLVPATLAPSQNVETSYQMLSVLESANVPISNYYDLAARLLGKHNVPLTLDAPLVPLTVNDQDEFWVTNTDTNDTFKIDVTLQYITDHVYFWVENGVNFNRNDLRDLAETFENQIYPTDREFFGSEWTPGVDNDQHLYIVLATNLGDSLAGYYSSADEYNPEVHEYSNAHEMFLLSADNVGLDEEFTYGVLAHEFQHMIHWYRDINEETWLNEGFSELAALLNGYDVGGFDQAYIVNTDLQLTDWASSIGDNSPHYGASFLFVSYFLDRFGEDATKAVVASSENGMTSINTVLAELNEIDPDTGRVITADDFFSDWVITNYINDNHVGNGRYSYQKYGGFIPASATEIVDDCPQKKTTTSVFQYAADYIELTCKGSHTIDFRGNTQVNILDVQANSGQYAYWSNKGDESDMTLTREFDFSEASGPLTLTYATWYDLEEDYDYAYVEISENGEDWTILHTPGGTDEDKSGNSFGWGYNGLSDRWIEESVDISTFAGKKVQIRFEYITDAAVNGEGLLVDDIRIPEVDYLEDFESGNGDWVGAGFVRTNNVLPQTYRINLLKFRKGNVDIQQITLDENNAAQIQVELKSGERAVLTVSGTTRFTRQPAIYEYTIE